MVSSGLLYEWIGIPVCSYIRWLVNISELDTRPSIRLFQSRESKLYIVLNPHLPPVYRLSVALFVQILALLNCYFTVSLKLKMTQSSPHLLQLFISRAQT